MYGRSTLLHPPPAALTAWRGAIELLPVLPPFTGLRTDREPWQHQTGRPRQSHSIVSCASKSLNDNDLSSGRSKFTVICTVRRSRLGPIEGDRSRSLYSPERSSSLFAHLNGETACSECRFRPSDMLIYPTNRNIKLPKELALTTLRYTQDPAVEFLQNPFVLKCRLQ